MAYNKQKYAILHDAPISLSLAQRINDTLIYSSHLKYEKLNTCQVFINRVAAASHTLVGKEASVIFFFLHVSSVHYIYILTYIYKLIKYSKTSTNNRIR